MVDICSEPDNLWSQTVVILHINITNAVEPIKCFCCSPHQFQNSLGFLLFSTMHLYHRLAVFDLQGNAFVRNPSFADAPGTMKSTLQSLELQLTELVELTGQVAQSLMHLTGEIREISLTTGSPTSGTPTAGQEPTSHSEPGPPV